jgi:UPF0176 protein
MFCVVALYQFIALPDFRELQSPIRDLCASFGIRGTLLLAPEGINGTLAGSDDGIARLVEALNGPDYLAGRMDGPELKYSRAEEMPFARLKIRLKKEIVTLAAPEADPTKLVGTYVAPQNWNALLDDPEVVLLDTRNDFEVALGTFDGAIDPNIRRFSDFKKFVAGMPLDARTRKIAMFCTGGIRCEKASAYMLTQGFLEVYHLKGGILKYLEEIPPEASRWHGGCFVFDERVALGHGLAEEKPEAPVLSRDERY